MVRSYVLQKRVQNSIFAYYVLCERTSTQRVKRPDKSTIISYLPYHNYSEIYYSSKVSGIHVAYVLAMAFQSGQNCQSMLNSDCTCSDNNLCTLKTIFACSKRFLPAQSEYCMLKNSGYCLLKGSHHRYHLRRATEAASRPSESRQGQSDVHGDRSVLCGRRIETK